MQGLSINILLNYFSIVSISTFFFLIFVVVHLNPWLGFLYIVQHFLLPVIKAFSASR